MKTNNEARAAVDVDGGTRAATDAAHARLDSEKVALFDIFGYGIHEKKKGKKVLESFLFSCGLKLTNKWAKALEVMLIGLSLDKVEKGTTKKLKSWKSTKGVPSNLYEINTNGLRNLCEYFNLSTEGKSRGATRPTGEVLREQLADRITAHVQAHGTAEVVVIEEEGESEELVTGGGNVSFLPGGIRAGSKKRKAPAQNAKPFTHEDYKKRRRTSYRSEGQVICSSLNMKRRLEQQTYLGSAALLATFDIEVNSDGKLGDVKWIGKAMSYQNKLDLLGHLAQKLIEQHASENSFVPGLDFVTCQADVTQITKAADDTIVRKREKSDSLVHLEDSTIVRAPTEEQ